MKNILIFLMLISSLYQCKKKDTKEVTIAKQAKEQIIQPKPEDLSCEQILKKIVESSNLELKGYNKYFTRIESINDDSITIQIYFENNVSDNLKEKQIIESVGFPLLVRFKSSNFC